MTAAAPRIAVVGSYGTGLTMRLTRVPEAGETVGGASFSAGPGGKGSNQAIGAARLGAQVSLLSAVGDDEFGASARRLWTAEGVDHSAVVTTQAATMVGVILVEPDGENRIVIASGALDQLTPEHVTAFADRIAAADLMMVCNEIPAETVAAALRVARDCGVPTLFNPAPARDIAPDSRPLVDYLTPNLGEAQILAGVDTSADPELILDRLRTRFGATIALTAGSGGVHVDDPGTKMRHHVAAIAPPAVVDTTGAGDAFNAAFAVAICRGADPVEAACYGAAAGALAVSRAEVIPALPTDEQIEHLRRTSR